MTKTFFIALASLLVLAACSKKNEKPLRYFEIGIKGTQADWRDTMFIVATNDDALIAKALYQINKPTDERQIITGELIKGNGGYNKNSTHSFGWRYKENSWTFTDFSAEIYDGRAYSDLDLDPDYWFNQMKRFAPWGGYVKREVVLSN